METFRDTPRMQNETETDRRTVPRNIFSRCWRSFFLFISRCSRSPIGLTALIEGSLFISVILFFLVFHKVHQCPNDNPDEQNCKYHVKARHKWQSTYVAPESRYGEDRNGIEVREKENRHLVLRASCMEIEHSEEHGCHCTWSVITERQTERGND